MTNTPPNLVYFIRDSIYSLDDDLTLFRKLHSFNFLSVHSTQFSDVIITLLNAHYENSLSRIVDLAFLSNPENKRTFLSNNILSFAFISPPKTLRLYFLVLEKFFGKKNPYLFTPNLLIKAINLQNQTEWLDKCEIYSDYWLRLWSPSQSFIHQDFYDSFADLFHSIILLNLSGISHIYLAFTHIGGCLDEIFLSHFYQDKIIITNTETLLFLHKPEIASFCLFNNLPRLLEYVNLNSVIEEFPQYFVSE